MFDVKGKNVLVMGLGLHGGGVATVKWLVKNGAKVIVTDLRTKKILEPSLKALRKYRLRYILGKHRVGDFLKAEIVVQNPGVPNDSPYLAIARKSGASIVNEATLFFQNTPTQFLIGVTGTKGKSSTATLIYEIIRKKYPKSILAGNIRTTAMLDAALRAKPQTPVVLELSSWQLEGLQNIRMSPAIGVITNIYQDHLNRYVSLQDYVRAKERIVAYQDKDGFAVFNADQPVLARMGRNYAKKGRTVVWFSRKKTVTGAFVKKGWVHFGTRNHHKRVVALSDLRVPGEHNIENLLAAVASTKMLGIPNKAIQSGVRAFRGVEGRLEYVGTKKGIEYYNDTAATAPDAVIAALRALGGKFAREKKIILIAGGADKGLEFSAFARAANRYAKSIVLFPGTATDKMLQAGLQRPIARVSSMRKAVLAATAFARSGDTVLLSPGAASFGLFLHEFDRGDQFLKAFAELGY